MKIVFEASTHEDREVMSIDWWEREVRLHASRRESKKRGIAVELWIATISADPASFESHRLG